MLPLYNTLDSWLCCMDILYNVGSILLVRRVVEGEAE